MLFREQPDQRPTFSPEVLAEGELAGRGAVVLACESLGSRGRSDGGEEEKYGRVAHVEGAGIERRSP